MSPLEGQEAEHLQQLHLSSFSTSIYTVLTQMIPGLFRYFSKLERGRGAAIVALMRRMSTVSVLFFCFLDLHLRRGTFE